MAAVHLEAHGGDVEKSLAAASSRQSWGLGPDCQRGPSKQERISGECLPGTQLVFDSSCVPVSAPMVHLPARCFSRCSWHGQETYQKAVTPVNTSCVPVSVPFPSSTPPGSPAALNAETGGRARRDAARTRANPAGREVQVRADPGARMPSPRGGGNRTPASRPRITRPPGPAGTPPARAAGGPRYPGVERSPCGGRRARSPACRAS